MQLIKNGKIVLNGTRTEQETEDLLLTGLEIIVDKNVDLFLLKSVKKASEYNLHRNLANSPLTGKQFKLLKEII